MTNTERAELIQNAMRDYNDAQLRGNAREIRSAINGMENVFIAVNLWGVPGTEELRQMILAANEKEAKTKRIFETYKVRLMDGGNFTRFNVIQYLCHFPGIDPYEMAASIMADGFKVHFDDSSISAKANKAHENKVRRLLNQRATA